jgi:hypothetical protein
MPIMVCYVVVVPTIELAKALHSEKHQVIVLPASKYPSLTAAEIACQFGDNVEAILMLSLGHVPKEEKFLVGATQSRCHCLDVKRQIQAGEPNYDLLSKCRRMGAPVGHIITVKANLFEEFPRGNYGCDMWSYGIAANCPGKYLTVLVRENDVRAGLEFVKTLLGIEG